jgi:hypothetical protein
MDSRLIVYAIWAGAMVVVWGGVVRYDWRAFKRDRRDNLPELVSDIALLASAIAAAAALIALILGQDVPGLRGFTLAVFLGAFLAAGIFKLTLRRRRKP